jgi:hypothetical protein
MLGKIGRHGFKQAVIFAGDLFGIETMDKTVLVARLSAAAATCGVTGHMCVGLRKAVRV